MSSSGLRWLFYYLCPPVVLFPDKVSLKMISHLGTFDVENYGDLLYPILFRHLLKKDTSLKVRHYSPLAVKAPQEAGFETDSITTLFAPSARAHTIVIGGGDI